MKNQSKNLVLNIKKRKPKPSKAYDYYWKFAANRQDIFFKRMATEKPPWSKDAVLNEYKFTNVYRATDRVSQFLIKNVIYKGSQEPNEVFFRTILFKIFNRISTWEFLKFNLNTLSLKKYSFKKYDMLLQELLDNKIAIYSAAYIMASGRSTFGFKRKHQNHLKLIEKMIADDLPTKLQRLNDMESAYQLLLTYPTIGEFLAYQYVTDINYSELTNFSEMEFVKAGPGAKDGIAKCFNDFGDYSFEDIIRLMTDNQEKEFERLNLNFQTLNGRKLQLIDCQNIFCEVGKYLRVVQPEVSGTSNRKRIKQKYIINQKSAIKYFYPPKWTMNIVNLNV